VTTPAAGPEADRPSWHPSTTDLGLAVFLGIVDRNDRDPAYLVGLIPMLVGSAFLFYAYVLAPGE
jgi:hypothetical protein